MRLRSLSDLASVKSKVCRGFQIPVQGYVHAPRLPEVYDPTPQPMRGVVQRHAAQPEGSFDKLGARRGSRVDVVDTGDFDAMVRECRRRGPGHVVTRAHGKRTFAISTVAQHSLWQLPNITEYYRT